MCWAIFSLKENISRNLEKVILKKYEHFKEMFGKTIINLVYGIEMKLILIFQLELFVK